MSQTHVSGAPEPAPARTVPRPRRRRWLRILAISTAVVGSLAVVVALTGVWLVRRSFPVYDGQLRLPGLSAPVTVHRDPHGIPQLYAATAPDLFRAQGYVHAQERFWEMDFRRHVTAGRTAELFGEAQVTTDRYLRTLGWRRVAEQEWSLISAQSRSHLSAYAEGVNAWLAHHGNGTASGAVSLEYAVLGLSNSGYRIERWDPVDSLSWLKAMAWDLRGNMAAEIERTALLGAGLRREQVEQLYPRYPFERNRPIVAGGDLASGAFVPTGPSAPAPSGGGAGGGAGGGPDGGPDGGPGSGQGGGPDGEGGSPDSGRTGDIGRTPGLVESFPMIDQVRRGLARLPAMLGTMGTGLGSNSWVLSGARTTTGRPVLANDPHLGPSMPGIWFQMGLHCTCEFNVAGYTFSGVPGVVIGHNNRIAWGFTNLGPDVTDLYLEKVDGDRYQVDGEWRDLDRRQETIKVAGAAPVTITVRTGKDGPLLSDASAELSRLGRHAPADRGTAGTTDADGGTAGTTGADGGTADPGNAGYAVALRWTATEPGRTMDAVFVLNQATDWSSFRRAAALFEVPAQNLVYADVDGNIGYQAPGRIPVRGKGDGRWPAPGWDPAYEWQGYLPFDELPNVHNPAQGYLVTANQAVVGPTYPRFLTDDWSYGYRSQRLNDLIAGAGKLSPADVQRMQFDSRNGMAPVLVPLLLAAPLSGRSAAAQRLLRDWDFQQPADGRAGSQRAHSSAAAAYYNAVWRHLLTRLFDELPAEYKPDGSDRWFEVVRALLDNPGAPWWDDRGTPRAETRDDIIAAAMRDAATELTRRLGADPARWRWGALHQLTVRNQSFGKSGIAAVEWLFNRGPVGTSGGDDIVNATGWNARDGYEVNWVPSMRMIVDLADLDASRWVQLTGASGHAFSRHYDDQFELWRTGGTLPMRWDARRIEREAAHTLTLRP